MGESGGAELAMCDVYPKHGRSMKGVAPDCVAQKKRDCATRACASPTATATVPPQRPNYSAVICLPGRHAMDSHSVETCILRVAVVGVDFQPHMVDGGPRGSRQREHLHSAAACHGIIGKSPKRHWRLCRSSSAAAATC